MKRAILVLALLAGGSPASAALVQYDFTGQINPGGANVKAPFTGTFFSGDPITGSFVIDDSLIPGSGSGYVNIPMNTAIPAADAFTLNLGSLGFTRADNIDTLLLPAQVQFLNGQFNGFVFNADFQFGGSWYLFTTQGSGISVYLLDGVPNDYNPHGYQVNFNSLINATINLELSGGTPYNPTAPAVPEPSSWAMLIAGLGAVGFAMRRRRTTVAFA